MMTTGSPAQPPARGRTVPASAGRGPADLVLKNGKIITVNRASTIAQAIAIADDRVLAVGPDAAMAKHTAATTRVIDLKGKARHPRHQ